MKLKKLIDNYDPLDLALKPPYIIAEAGVNHEGDMELAKRLIREAKIGGADAIKFQTYKAEKIASINSPAYWDVNKENTTSQYELFQKYDSFGEDEFKTLSDFCKSIEIEFISTPFDKESATFLNNFMDVFKISSSDLTNKPFIEHICKFNKPIILSTGASNIDEIKEAANWITNQNVKVVLLHCVLNYPTPDESANLGMIIDLKKNFPDKMIGYSDHTLPKEMKILEMATLLGARIIEKHFTHDKNLKGNDHYHAMDKDDLKFFKNNLNYIFSSLGSFEKHSLSSEKISRINARRSIVALRNIEVGEIIFMDDLTFKRPGNGISPKFISEVAGKKAIKKIKKDQILKWDCLN